MFKYSTGFKDACLDTGSVKSEFENMVIKYYDGPVPAASATAASPADAAETGTLLCTITGPAAANLDLAAAAAGGSIEKLSSQVWSGTAVADGTATHFRAETSSDTQAESATEKRIQGTIGTTGGYDMQMSSATIVDGDTYTIDYFTLEFLGG